MIPSQFQHVGIHSSLGGKIQKLTDSSFKLSSGKSGKNKNPVLSGIYTDIGHYQRNTIGAAYMGSGNFWGKEFKNGKTRFY